MNYNSVDNGISEKLIVSLCRRYPDLHIYIYIYIYSLKNYLNSELMRIMKS